MLKETITKSDISALIQRVQDNHRNTTDPDVKLSLAIFLASARYLDRYNPSWRQDFADKMNANKIPIGQLLPIFDRQATQLRFDTLEYSLPDFLSMAQESKDQS